MFAGDKHYPANLCKGYPERDRSYRLLIVASRPNPRYPNAPRMEPTALLNPRIVARSDEMVKGWEGCLSIPAVRGLVPRYRAIEVEYTSRDGNLLRLELTDFVARIFQQKLSRFGNPLRRTTGNLGIAHLGIVSRLNMFKICLINDKTYATT